MKNNEDSPKRPLNRYFIWHKTPTYCSVYSSETHFAQDQQAYIDTHWVTGIMLYVYHPNRLGKMTRVKRMWQAQEWSKQQNYSATPPSCVAIHPGGFLDKITAPDKDIPTGVAGAKWYEVPGIWWGVVERLSWTMLGNPAAYGCKFRPVKSTGKKFARSNNPHHFRVTFFLNQRYLLELLYF